MNNFLTDDTKAIILLCGVFGKDRSQKPLSLTEYSSLVRWLIEVKMRPGDLLQKDNIVDAPMWAQVSPNNGWNHCSDEEFSLALLLKNGSAVAFGLSAEVMLIIRFDIKNTLKTRLHRYCSVLGTVLC